MSQTSFPVNDLIRRKLQTSLVIVSLTLCVTSTLFLLLFCQKIGIGITATVENKLTAGFSTIFTPFLIFVGVLVFVVGAVIASFMVFVMMSQRVRDIGLMKATGCPNELIFGYFMTEILIVTVASCVLGIALGVVADLVSTSLLGTFGLHVPQAPITFWLILLVFAIFLFFGLIFGAKPVLDTTKIESAKAISPAYYFGLGKESSFKAVSKSNLTFKIAMRSLFRRKSATIRIILCLSTVFILVTVAVAGGIIANQTTRNWVEKAIGRDVILIAHQDMCSQYALLLSKFYEAKEEPSLNYTDEKYLIPKEILNNLNSMPEISIIDTRLILKAHILEIQNYTFNPSTGETIPVGDDREGDAIVVGIEPEKTLSAWFLDGRFLGNKQAQEAIVGDSLAQKLFSSPLDQGLKMFNETSAVFDVVGVCLDPINNGNVTYVPLETLQNIMGVSKPNLVMVKINHSINYADVLNQIRANVSSVNAGFVVFELNGVLDKNLGFLEFIWSVIMFLPLFSLASASLCLIGYVMLSIAEQRQEFGVLRALGAKPRTVVEIVAGQSLIVLLASYAVGIALGVIITLMILMPEPLVTNYTIMEIAGWLLTAFWQLLFSACIPPLNLQGNQSEK
ncbi:MAG: FtsX-like permease family protein [Candidatus Bathyarchaeota archaeon]|nr:FtsX-like permease family protein [Candidatus Bathyarchaeota archaeon A05DMB-5]MDH7558341.1 FtsX-like permease family protein [Candidatus Bathyarchaeota archaeon]